MTAHLKSPKNYNYLNDKTFNNLENEIHVWTYDLNQPQIVLTSYKELLNSQELERYNDYYFDKDKRKYLATNGFTKTLIAQYLKTNIKEVRLTKTTFGKPYVDNPNLQFSISYAHELAAISLSKEATGIDIEYTKRQIDHEKIARVYLFKREYKKYQNTPKSNKKRFFYDMWTRKEAAIKCIGDEINVNHMDLKQSYLKKNNNKMVLKYHRGKLKKEIITYSFHPKQNYIGAIATTNKNLKTIFYLTDNIK